MQCKRLLWPKIVAQAQEVKPGGDQFVNDLKRTITAWVSIIGPVRREGDVMRDRVVGDLTASRQDFPVVIASMPASKQERRLAFGLIALVWLAFAVVAPFAHIPLARVDAFVPVLQTVMCIVDLITAVLLFAQYSIVPKRALLAVACGYVFSGIFAFLQTLAFPGAYSPNGLIGDGVNTAAWFFVLWHASFSLSVAVYALLKDANETASVSHISTPPSRLPWHAHSRQQPR